MTNPVAVSGITGSLGGTWRADVTSWGAVVPWDGSPSLDWVVAADDRWHRPAEEVAVRQHRLAGTPVFETRLRIPGGDAVQRVWSVAGGGGLTVVEIRNDSPLPIAVAFTRPDVLTARAVAAVPLEGVDLAPETTVVLPVGHRTSVRVALAHDGRCQGPLPADVAGAEQVAQGWTTLAGRAGHLALPDARLAEAVVAARCDVALGEAPDPGADPVGYLLAVGELVRLGLVGAEELRTRVVDVAAAARVAAATDGWRAAAALAAAARLLARAGEDRAVDDVVVLLAGRSSGPPPLGELPPGVAAVAAIERSLAREGVLLPDGLPPLWRGSPLEAHGVPVGPTSSVSFALRWHGEHAAVLWEVDGGPVALSAPALDPTWRTGEQCGEALWRGLIPADPAPVGGRALP